MIDALMYPLAVFLWLLMVAVYAAPFVLIALVLVVALLRGAGK